MLAVGLSFALRAVVVSLAVFILGLGWALVFSTWQKLRRGETVAQSPPWLGALFMLGIMLVNIGLVWTNWDRISSPVVLPGIGLIILGLVAKATTILIAAVRMSRH